MKYEIISRDDQAALMEAVNEYLSAGWELQGGVSVTNLNEIVLWAQALVKRS